MKKFRIEKDAIYVSKELIESGLYFKDSVKWYTDMFVSPLSTAMSYMLLVAVYLFCISISGLFVVEMFPLRERVSMVIKIAQPPETYIKLRHLRKYSTPKESIIMTVVENYVIQRESYLISEGKSPIDILEQKVAFVEATSSIGVSSLYKEFISTYNSITGNFVVSGIQTMANVISSTFDIEDKSFMSSIISNFIPKKPSNAAIVYFTSTNSQGIEKRFKAKISYVFRIDRKNGKDILDFIVTSYRVARV